MVMVAPQNHQELAANALGLVHRVAQSPLGDLWIALDQRRGPPGEPLLLRYVSLAGGATVDTLERVVAAAHAAMSLRNELLLPVVEVLQQGPLAVAYEYVEALPLSTLQSSARARELAFPVGVSLRLIIDLLRALQAVHESWLGWPTEVPYGGLLPASVLVSRAGRTHLCDALVASSALLQRGFDLSAAELAYRAPEQVYASTPPEPSTDVFIAAILLWELLSGHRLLSGSKEAIERKLLEHHLPRATSSLRADGQLSRGLLELLDSSLSLDPNQRPPTPRGLALALERCGHVVASHAEVAAFVNELAGAQLDRVATIVRLALGYAAGADDAPAADVPSDGADEQPETVAARPDRAAAPPGGAAAQWGAQAPPSSVAATEARERAVAPAAPPAAGKQAGAALPSGMSRSLAAAVALALERRRASGEFPAFAPEAARAVSRARSLGGWAALQLPARSAVLPRGAGVATSVSADAQLPPAAPSLTPSVPPPLPSLLRDGPADTSSSEDEEKTTVQPAVRDHGAVRDYTTPSAPVRLATKRALLATMAAVVLLIQLWMFALARSHKERSRSAAPESEPSSEQGSGAAPRESERVETELHSTEEATEEPLRASEQ